VYSLQQPAVFATLQRM